MKGEEKKREKLSPEKQKKNERRRKGVDVCSEQMEIHLLSCIKFFLSSKSTNYWLVKKFIGVFPYDGTRNWDELCG